MNFEFGDIVKLSHKAKDWKDNYNQPYYRADNLKYNTNYRIEKSHIAGGEEWVDIENALMIYPAWCFELVEKSNSGIKGIEPTIIQTEIPGISIIRYNK